MLNPLQARQWDLQKAAHLLNRAGFGGTPDEIKAFYELGLDKAVQTVLGGPDDSANFPKPNWAAPMNMMQVRQQMVTLTADQKKMVQQNQQKEYREEGVDLIGWWLNRMRYTANPYREKMTLFWHGHFATSIEKVHDTYLMWQQNELLREKAFGNYGLMVKAISRDPAMLIWLDTRESRIDHPNENFAREVMELFTLGIGNYTETDIQQSARAFTGYRISPIDQTFQYAPRQHDETNKTFLGRTGPFTGDDIIDIILEQPACAEYIARKIWTFYAYEEPEPQLVNELAAQFRNSSYEIRPLMNTIFRSAEFYSPDAVRSQVKSPVQWVIQTSKILETDLPKPDVTVTSLRTLGQVPFSPPNVKGWDGGRSWITTSTLLYRYNMANFEVGTGSLAASRPRAQLNPNKAAPPSVQVQNYDSPDLTKIVPALVRTDPTRLVAYLCFRLYQDELTSHDTDTFLKYVRDKGTNMDDPSLRYLLHLMMSTPQYQLT
jgi:uncharacterized protein (DUF1800 family)